MFFNLAKVHNDALVENALRIYSLAFIPMAISTTLIFYYEGIERAVESGIIALISELLGPLGFTFALYPSHWRNKCLDIIPIGICFINCDCCNLCKIG